MRAKVCIQCIFHEICRPEVGNTQADACTRGRTYTEDKRGESRSKLRCFIQSFFNKYQVLPSCQNVSSPPETIMKWPYSLEKELRIYFLPLTLYPVFLLYCFFLRNCSILSQSSHSHEQFHNIAANTLYQLFILPA